MSDHMQSEGFTLSEHFARLQSRDAWLGVIAGMISDNLYDPNDENNAVIVGALLVLMRDFPDDPALIEPFETAMNYLQDQNVHAYAELLSRWDALWCDHDALEAGGFNVHKCLFERHRVFLIRAAFINMANESDIRNVNDLPEGEEIQLSHYVRYMRWLDEEEEKEEEESEYDPVLGQLTFDGCEPSLFELFDDLVIPPEITKIPGLDELEEEEVVSLPVMDPEDFMREFYPFSPE